MSLYISTVDGPLPLPDNRQVAPFLGFFLPLARLRHVVRVGKWRIPIDFNDIHAALVERDIQFRQTRHHGVQDLLEVPCRTHCPKFIAQFPNCFLFRLATFRFSIIACEHKAVPLLVQLAERYARVNRELRTILAAMRSGHVDDPVGLFGLLVCLVAIAIECGFHIPDIFLEQFLAGVAEGFARQIVNVYNAAFPIYDEVRFARLLEQRGEEEITMVASVVHV